MFRFSSFFFFFFISHIISISHFRTPLISSQRLSQCSAGKTQIPLYRLQGQIDIQGDWMMFAVLLEKSEARKSANGKKYQIWKLGNLKKTIISLFLFGSVYEKHWKESIGSVIALLNPKMIPSRNSDGIALELDLPEKLMTLGQCAFFGFCRGIRKDTSKCTIPVDK